MESKSLQNVKVRTLEDINNFSKVVLWGAGFQCEDTIGLVEKIAAIFDNDRAKWGKNICGFAIKSPETDLKEYITSDTAVIISTHGYQYEIAEDLVTNKGIEERQIFCCSSKTSEQWRYRPDIILKQIEEIQKVYDKLADQESKHYYINFLKACLTRNPFFYKDNPRSVAPYEYETDLAKLGLQGGEVILDCGAFNGDTAKLFRKKTNGNCEIYCFEPVEENYNELSEWVKCENIRQVHAIRAGVGKEKHTDKVYSTEAKTMRGTVGTRRCNGSNPVISEIQVDSLDNMLKEKKVDYIKMDIEGAEMDALRGAKKVIARNHPQMLISAYHKITDMWEIPEIVLNIHPDYKVFLGHQPHAPYEPEFMFI